MEKGEESLQKWKENVYFQTQGNVDVDRDHPNLGRYLGPGFFKDKEWWTKSRELLTEEENATINHRFDNLFSPKAILFADKSQTTRNMFNMLLDGGISLRVLPTDQYISQPAVGHIILDLLFRTEDQVKAFVEIENVLSRKIRGDLRAKQLKFQPDPDFAVLMSKIRQIQIERAIVEMSRIQRS